MGTTPSAWLSSLGASLPLSLSPFSSRVFESLSRFVSFCLSLSLRVCVSQALSLSVSLFSLNLSLRASLSLFFSLFLSLFVAPIFWLR